MKLVIDKAQGKTIIWFLAFILTGMILVTGYEITGERAAMTEAYRQYYEQEKEHYQATPCTNDGVTTTCPDQSAILGRPGDPRTYIPMHLEHMLWTIPGAVFIVFWGVIVARKTMGWLRGAFSQAPTWQPLILSFLLLWTILAACILVLAPHLSLAGHEAHVIPVSTGTPDTRCAPTCMGEANGV